MSLAAPQLKIARQIDSLSHFRKHGWAYPIAAEIDLTWKCSLNCKGCHSKWMHTENQELKPGGIERILTQLHQHGLKSVTWAGGGEPLESPYWQYAVHLAANLGLDQGLYSYLPGMIPEKIESSYPGT